MPRVIVMPALSPSMDEGRLTRWLVPEGAEIQTGDVIAEIETDKTTLEFEAEDNGILARHVVPAGAPPVPVGSPIALMVAPGETVASATDLPPPPTAQEAPAPAPKRRLASPRARALAEARGLDLTQITGSGPGGRIVEADLPQAETPVIAQLIAPTDTASQRQPLDPMRRAIATRMTEAQSVPQITLRRALRVDALLALHQSLRSTADLTLTDWLLLAAGRALHQTPALNRLWNLEGLEVQTQADIALAVAVDGGLRTPVFTALERQSLRALSRLRAAQVAAARAGQIPPQEAQGGSMTLSNLGMFGVDSFDAMITPPHSAALGLGRVQQVLCPGPDGTPRAEHHLMASLTVDHRVIDGAEAAPFLVTLNTLLQQPAHLLTWE